MNDWHFTGAAVSFNEEALAGAARGLARLRAAAGAPGQEGPDPESAPPESPPGLGGRPGLAPSLATPPGLGGQGGPARARFEAAMDDDFNTSAALAALFDLAAELNTRRGDPTAAADR